MCCGGGRDPGGTEARLRRGLGGPWALGSHHQQHTALCWVLTDPGPSATLQLSVQRPALRSHCPFYRIPWMGWQGSPSAVLSGRVGTHWVSWGMRGPPPLLPSPPCGTLMCISMFLSSTRWGLLAGEGCTSSPGTPRWATVPPGARQLPVETELGQGGRGRERQAECQRCLVGPGPWRDIQGHKCNSDCGSVSIHLQSNQLG